MRWPWRAKEDTASPGDNAALKESEARKALQEARHALYDVREKKKDGFLITETLAEIRKTNHFKDMWDQGLRGG